MNLKSKIIVILLCCLFITYSSASKLESKEVIKNVKIQSFYKAISYSDELLSFNKQKDNFDFCVNFINKTIFTYGEDSVQTYLSYLLLARHYIIYNKLDAGNELLLFVDTIKENKSFENDPDIKEVFYTLKGDLFKISSDPITALKYYKKALAIHPSVKNKDYRVEIILLNHIASVQISMHKIDEGKKTLSKVIVKLNKTNNNADLPYRIEAYINYSKIYEVKGDYKSAILAIKEFLSLYPMDDIKKTPKSIELFMVYSTYLTQVFQWDKVLFTAGQALEIQKKLRIADGLFTITNLYALANAEKYLKKYEESKKAFTKALEKVDKITIDSMTKKELSELLKDEIEKLEKKVTNK